VTDAPQDLLGFRARMQSLTGLSPVDVGIVGDAAHARSGGYHIGRTGLREAGVWDTDYSVRLPRDRNGATESASASDVGCGWRQGRAVWIRWNNLLANALRAGDPALAAVRAINYSPDGSLRWRIDRESGLRTESSSDSVDIHTHIEWYRDTEGRRQPCLDRIAALAQQAITGQLAPEDSVKTNDEIYDALVAIANGNQPPGGGNSAVPEWVKTMQAAAKQTAEVLAAVKALAAPAAIDVQALAAALVAAGVGQVDVPTLAAALEEHLPTHITLTGTVA
jgi:hypothetical protein